MGLQEPEQPVPFANGINWVKGSVHADSLALQLNEVFPRVMKRKPELDWRSRLPAWLTPRSLRRPVPPKV